MTKLDYPPMRRIPNLGRLLGDANALLQAEAPGPDDVNTWCTDHAYLHLATTLLNQTGFTPHEIYEEAAQRTKHCSKLDYVWAVGILRVQDVFEEAEECAALKRLQQRRIAKTRKRLP